MNNGSVVQGNNNTMNTNNKLPSSHGRQGFGGAAMRILGSHGGPVSQSQIKIENAKPQEQPYYNPSAFEK
jgi:hypothetical protein